MDAGMTVGLGALIAALVAIIKSAVPDIQPRVLPLLVLIIAATVVGVGAYSGEVDGTPFDLLAQVVAQAAAAIGLRQGVGAAAPGAVARLASGVQRQP